MALSHLISNGIKCCWICCWSLHRAVPYINHQWEQCTFLPSANFLATVGEGYVPLDLRCELELERSEN